MPSEPHRYRVTAYRGDAPFAFVGYSHDDAAVVFPELQSLVDAGVRVYYDEGIHPGHRWHDELADALERCAVYVFFATPRSVKSRNCQDEITFVAERDKPILAVHLEDTDLPPGLRLAIGSRQAIVKSKFDEARYRERLIDAVRQLVGATDSPVGEREAPHTNSEALAPMRAAAAAQSTKPAAAGGVWRFRTIGIALALAVAVAALAYWRHAEALRTERAARVAKVEALIQQDAYGAAFTLAQPMLADAAGRSDAKLQALWKQIVLPGTPLVAESGATLSYKAYDDTDDGWIVAGTTPIERMLELPKDVVRIKLEKAGFQTGEFVVANPGPSLKSEKSLGSDFLRGFITGDVPLPLAPVGKVPNDMVLVPATDEPIYLAGLSDYTGGFDRRPLPEYAIARFEVTNREYKEFIDAGGYDNPVYWEGLKFRDEGRELGWAEARARFVDKTGRAGPAEWELGAYPADQGGLPVSGISWYEAVAYSRFRQLTLPTLHHWARAAFAPFEGAFETAPWVAAASRLAADGPIEAQQRRGLGPWGTWNTAGNVREWVWNFDGEQAITLGGSWGEDRDTYQALETAPPMRRVPEVGLRLMKTFEPVADEVLAPIAPQFDPANAARNPISDEAFATMRFQFTIGARTPTDVEVAQFAETDAWTAEEVRLTYAKDDVLSVYLVLPRTRHGPLQPVLWGTPGGGVAQPNRDVLEHLRTADVIVRGGRALVIPIWSNQYQRVETAPTTPDAAADQFRRWSVQFYQDGVRTIDYLATRADVDAKRVGFMGVSFGSINIAPPILAFDGRVRAAVLASAGVWIWPLPFSAPMIDIVNFAPRIRTPVLMINGRYDSVMPYELSQKRLFDLLGSPPEDKRQVLFDVSHFTFPHSQLAKEVNDWFDKYLGPVK